VVSHPTSFSGLSNLNRVLRTQDTVDNIDWIQVREWLVLSKTSRLPLTLCQVGQYLSAQDFICKDDIYNISSCFPTEKFNNSKIGHQTSIPGNPSHIYQRGKVTPVLVAKFFLEFLYEYVDGITLDQFGKFGHRSWTSTIGTLFLFVFASNWYGALVPLSLLSSLTSLPFLGQAPLSDISAPTNNINVVVSLSLLSSLIYFVAGIRIKGLNFFSRYVYPSYVFLPLNLLEDFSKPLSLSFRLFGNVLADEIVVSVLSLLLPFFVPLPVMVLGLFAGSVQALVFATLSVAYLSEVLE
jgi:F-type H+-transporting ATPase subunit a